MRIQLNGQAYELPGAVTLDQLLARLDIDPRVVAVEHNRIVVKRARYGDTMIEEGDEVEIVAFVGGGAGGIERPCVVRRARRRDALS